MRCAQIVAGLRFPIYIAYTICGLAQILPRLQLRPPSRYLLKARFYHFGLQGIVAVVPAVVVVVVAGLVYI